MRETELSFLPSDMISTTVGSSVTSSSDQSSPSAFSSNSSLSLSLESFYTESVSNVFTTSSYVNQQDPYPQQPTSLSNAFTSESSFFSTTSNGFDLDYQPIISYSQFEILTTSTNMVHFDDTFADENNKPFYDPTLYSHACNFSTFDQHDVASSCDLTTIRSEMRHSTARINPPMQQHEQQGHKSAPYVITNRHFQMTSSTKESFKLVERIQPKKSRTKYTKDQIDVLEASFGQNAYPDLASVEHLAKTMGICKDKINIWFQNRRARSKKQ